MPPHRAVEHVFRIAKAESFELHGCFSLCVDYINI